MQIIHFIFAEAKLKGHNLKKKNKMQIICFFFTVISFLKKSMFLFSNDLHLKDVTKIMICSIN